MHEDFYLNLDTGEPALSWAKYQIQKAGNPLSSDAVYFRRVYDEDATFVNLAGVTVDLRTGNIAFGLFPDPNNYYTRQNLYDLIRNTWLDIEDWDTKLDMAYYVQLMKLDPLKYTDEVYDDVSNALLGLEGYGGNSILLRAASLQKKRDSECKRLDTLKHLARDSRHYAIWMVLQQCVNIMRSYEEYSGAWYGDFLPEQTRGDMDANLTTVNPMYLKKPNMEALTTRYLRGGVPAELLRCMRSYGHQKRERKALCLKLGKHSYGEYAGMFQCCRALSGHGYQTNASDEFLLAYNFMDMVRGAGWENNALYGVEALKNGQPEALDEILKKFHAYDVLDDLGLNTQAFVRGLIEYGSTMSLEINTGAFHGKPVKHQQGAYASFAPTQVLGAGRMFDSLLGNKIFDKEANQ